MNKTTGPEPAQRLAPLARIFHRLVRVCGECGLALAGILLAGSPLASPAQDLDSLLDQPAGKETKKGGAVDELISSVGGGTLFRLVPFDNPGQGLTNRVFWRRFSGYCGVQTFPVAVKLDDKDVIGPKMVQDEKTFEMWTEYPTEGQRLIAAGQHVIQPGNIPLALDGKLSSTHPAVNIAGDEVRILCAPVRLEVMDSEERPLPYKIRLSCAGMNLLREEANFNPLIIWLPVGLKYTSSHGAFEVGTDGKVKTDPAELEKDVKAMGDGLRLVVSARTAATPAKVTPAPKTIYLLSHRGRTVFAQPETATFTVIVPRGFGGGEARILCTPAPPAKEGKPLDLGKVDLPAVTQSDFDSRLFTLNVPALAPGSYQLRVESSMGQSKPIPVAVVPWYLQRSPFFTHTMSGCTGLWPSDDRGLELLYDSGLEMATGTGFTGLLDAGMPRITPASAALALASNAPPETAMQVSTNDFFLERCMRHQMPIVDMCVVRTAAFYMESLSYHHSYKPSVDRMVRRMQIFTQQTADYPSFWGVNYSWFPALFGYSEGGVPTDAHTHDRNLALAANLSNAGYTNATPDELKWYEANRFSADPAAREKAMAILRQAVRYWKAQMDFGFGRHNKLYNDAVRQVRPDMAFTLFENAGHDALKRTRSLFNDMNACCYESYTDYGEWPMSASFTTDWARGNYPGKPVWITMDWGTSSEGDMKSLFHAFGRGLSGGGVPMEETRGLAELARRGKGLKLASQYGAIAANAKPDGRFAILVTDAEQIFDGRAQYAYHAVYYHLTRLGCAPVLVDEETVTAGGVPATAKVLFIVRQQHPLDPKVEAAIEAFQQKGGKIVATVDSRVKPKGAVVVDAKVKHIWELAGFEGAVHAQMWEEFEKNWRTPLSKALAETGVAPFATTDPDQGLVVGMDAGPVRYAVVVADKQGTHSGAFEPTDGLPVSLEGTGWTVRDLVKQTTLRATSRDGRTEVAVDLITEPTTILALFKAAPDKIQAKVSSVPALGSDLAFSCDVTAADGSSLGRVPVSYALVDADGRERLSVFRAGGEESRFPLAALDKPGRWTLRVQELLTGLAAQAPLDVAAPASAAMPVAPIGDVHIVNRDHLRAFAARTDEKVLIVEPGRRELLAVARKLTDSLVASGIRARLWQVKPEEFDTVPMRYYPRPEDTRRMELIEAGKLIGFRENMKPYIDTRARAHIPSKGGVAEIEPFFMVGKDCILFSGGLLAESLRAVTPWMNTPSVPGRGQGRLLTVFSPFMADRHVVAVIANDGEGMAKAADQLAAALAEKPPPPPPAAPPPALKPVAVEARATPVPQPYLIYSPLQRVRRLLASADGKAVVFLNGKRDNAAFVDENGTLTSTVVLTNDSPESASVDSQGRLWSCAFNAAGEKGAIRVTLSCIRPDGTLEKSAVVYEGAGSDLGPYRGMGSFPVAPDGATAALGRPAGMLLGKTGAPDWIWYDDLPHVRKTFEVWTPRFPIAMTFSPDSRYLFLTMDTRPGGYENMHQPLNRPEGAESVLVEVATGKRLWSLRAEPADYASYPGFAAVAADGSMTAFADVFKRVCLVDRAGKIAQEELLEPKSLRNAPVSQPPGGVGVWISSNGKRAAFGFKNHLVLAGGGKMQKVALADLCSGAVSDDGALAIVGLGSGDVKAFDAAGKEAWTFATGGVVPRVAAVAAGQTLVATSSGDLVRLDRAGKELKRTPLAEAADKGKHGPARAAGFQAVDAPAYYRSPATLKIAVERLGAERVAEWKPDGQGKAVLGQTFYPAAGRVELSGPPSGEAFAHLVYRRPAENKKLTVSIAGKGAAEEFILDLPTPAYRVVDIPFRTGDAKVSVVPEGPVEIAEFSIWSYAWPGPNLAFVKPPDAAGPDTTDRGDDDLDGVVADLDEGGGGAVGRMKDCRIWAPNPDIDKVSGPWLASPANPFLLVNRKWWEEKPAPWFAAGMFPGKYIGEWFTENFGKPAKLSLAATYDRSRKQSELTSNLAIFSGMPGGEGSAQGSDVLGGCIENDQFWRLFSFAPANVSVFGAYVYRADPIAEGLSEIEAYR